MAHQTLCVAVDMVTRDKLEDERLGEAQNSI